MIRIETSECIPLVFSEQDIATLNAFSNVFLNHNIDDICDAGIVTKQFRTFYCTRENEHVGLHIACGTGVVAVFDDDAVDFRDDDGAQF